MAEEDYQVPPEFKKQIDEAVSSGKAISFMTYVLGDSGENKIKYIINAILSQTNRQDLMELLYTAAKELIVNSTKAAIKRIIFLGKGLNLDRNEDYETGMLSFKEHLNEKKFPYYRSQMKGSNFIVKIQFLYNRDRIILKVINNFPLLDQEEVRVREKFHKAKKYDNLFEFFMEHGDNSEGAGMGITMVEILFTQSGFDRHLFTIYSSKMKNSTIARVEIPLRDDYLSNRMKFEKNIQSGNDSREKLRQEWSAILNG